MTNHALTKDEKFMLRLYTEASKEGNIYNPQDRYHIGKLIGLQARAVDTICTLLAQANFIKKQSETRIFITPHGVKLVERLRG